MKPMRKNEDMGACLALLLLILGLGLGHALFSGDGAGPAPCENPQFVEAAGHVPNPGVYEFRCTPPAASDLASRAFGSSGGSMPTESREDPRLASGSRVVFTGGPGGRGSFRIEDMNAFYLLTLGMPVPINRCSLEELTALSGIGPGLAAAIVDHRERTGGFHHPEDLLEVHGIGPRTLERLKPHITLHREAGFIEPS
jgi:competence protein ComEA